MGKSKKLRTRLLSYFRAAYPSDKGARILRDAHTIEWEYVPSDFAALLTELRLIKRFRPRRNVALKRDDRNLCFIKLGGVVAPKLSVVRGPGNDDSALYYGPFLGAVRIADAVRELSDVLGLRDCSLDKKLHFSDQAELFQLAPRTPGCLRYELRKCLGPCVAWNTSAPQPIATSSTGSRRCANSSGACASPWSRSLSCTRCPETTERTGCT